VENVVAALIFLAEASKEKVDRECFIISDDDAAKNNYFDVAREIRSVFPVKIPRQLPFFKIPSSILALALYLKGRSNINPKRKYSSKKLADFGFEKKTKFHSALKNYLENYLK
jgi:nucleoside-diphosphate-sugar epimerase